jgi:poly-gamma-glutamate capsule biosynthesis protein CapA/YwtB (metallophosphatase superfamily)
VGGSAFSNGSTRTSPRCAGGAEIIVASFRGGDWEVLQYMTQIAHDTDAGADVVVGSPHFSLPIEVYKGKQIFYGLGSFRSIPAMAESMATGSA